MKLGSELDTISSFEIEKHIKFFISKSCYSGKINHILRTTSPDISREFCRSFNYLRTKFFAALIDVNPELIRSHAAFLGGGKNFVFEVCNRFPNDINLLNFTSNNFLRDLQNALDCLPSKIWSKCFPDNVQEIPSGALVNLRYCVKKLQQKLTIFFEGLDFNVRLGSAKKDNPAFANFLLDAQNSSSSCLITQIPQIYGLLLNDTEFSCTMRLRCFILPDNVPHNLNYKCISKISPNHLFNCKHFITFRSKVHDAVRDQLYCMSKSHRIVSYLEPLLSRLVDEDILNSFGRNRGDLMLEGLEGTTIITDVRSTDACNDSFIPMAQSKYRDPLTVSEKSKIDKYKPKLLSLNAESRTHYVLCPFAVSFHGTLGYLALSFLDDFLEIVKQRTGRVFDKSFWQNRIVFSIFKGVVPLLSSALLSLGRVYERKPSSQFFLADLGYEDIEFYPGRIVYFLLE
ncbi:hypothetical protein P9112_007238 [Eukaryota sp. TZLM1-RC]